MDSNYWTRRAMGRRTAIRGGALGLAGLAGAALIGCGGGDGDGDAAPATPQLGAAAAGGQAQTATAVAGGGSDTPVSADQVRIKPGLSDGPTPPSAAELNPSVNAKYGGTLKMRYLDPPRMDLSRTLSCTIYHTLSYVTNKLTRAKTGALADPYRVQLEGDLAESWEAADNGQTFTFKLRPGVKFHNKAPVNGREFVANDVLKTVEMYSAGSQKDVFSMVSSVEAPDDHTVVFKLNQPLGDFPLNVGAWSYMYPAELVDDEEQRQEIAIGTGAFIQKEWIRQERSAFVKNPDYFEKGLPYLDGIDVFVQNDANAARAGFATDNYFDYTPRDAADMEALFKENSDDMVGETTARARGANVNGFQFQMKNPVYQDERIRRAMSLAFDRTEYDVARNGGDNINPEGPYSNSPMPWAFLFDEYPTAKVNGPWYQFDPAQASQLMQAAGYTADKPLNAEMPSFYYRTELSQLVVPGINQNLPEVNITFREIDNPTHVTVMSSRSFEEMVGFLWGPPGYSMDQWIYPFFHSEGSLNYGSIVDPDLDAMLVAQRTETNPDAQKEIWLKISDRIHDQVYQAWFPEPLIRTVWHNYMLNYRNHGLVGSYVCYSTDQARAIWLDDGAPGLTR